MYLMIKASPKAKKGILPHRRFRCLAPSEHADLSIRVPKIFPLINWAQGYLLWSHYHTLWNAGFAQLLLSVPLQSKIWIYFWSFFPSFDKVLTYPIWVVKRQTFYRCTRDDTVYTQYAENEDLKNGVYSPSVRDSVQNLFGTWNIMKMRALTGTVKVGLKEHIKYLKDYRIKA